MDKNLYKKRVIYIQVHSAVDVKFYPNKYYTKFGRQETKKKKNLSISGTIGIAVTKAKPPRLQSTRELGPSKTITDL